MWWITVNNLLKAVLSTDGPGNWYRQFYVHSVHGNCRYPKSKEQQVIGRTRFPEQLPEERLDGLAIWSSSPIDHITSARHETLQLIYRHMIEL